MRRAVTQFFYLQSRQGRSDALLHILLAYAQLQWGESDLVPHRRHEQLYVAILEHQAYPPAKIKIEGILQEGRLGQWFPEGEHGTLIGKIQPIQDLQQRALPASIRTQDDQAFPRRDCKVNLIQGRDLLIIGKTQVRYTEYQLVFHE